MACFICGSDEPKDFKLICKGARFHESCINEYVTETKKIDCPDCNEPFPHFCKTCKNFRVQVCHKCHKCKKCSHDDIFDMTALMSSWTRTHEFGEYACIIQVSSANTNCFQIEHVYDSHTSKISHQIFNYLNESTS